jgi:hypothetical protein
MPMKSRGCPVSHLSPWQPARLPSFSCILSFFHALWPDDVAEGSSRRSRTGGDDRGEHLQPDAALVPGTYSGLNRQGGRMGGTTPGFHEPQISQSDRFYEKRGLGGRPNSLLLSRGGRRRDISMERSHPNALWLKGRKSRHQFQINRKN